MNTMQCDKTLKKETWKREITYVCKLYINSRH